MSFGMYGVPSPTEPPAPQSFYDMKHAFAKQFLSGDGSLRCEPLEISGAFREVVLVWLKGYMAASNSGRQLAAEGLYSFIANNEQGVHLWIGDWLDGPHGDRVEPEDESVE